MKLHAPVLLALSLLLHTLRAGTFYEFTSSTPTSLGEGWAVVSAESARGKALRGTTAGTDVSIPVELGSHPVFSFLAKNAGSTDETLAVIVDGGDPATNVNLSADGLWTRHVVSLANVASGSHSLVWHIAPQSGSSPVVWLDDVYVGRQFTTSLEGVSDVWSGTDAAEGAVTLSDGVYSGSWTTTGSGSFSWNNSQNGFYIQMFAAQVGKSQYLMQCVPLEAPVSDTILVSFELLPNTRNRPDFVRPFISLDNGTTREFIGELVCNTNAEFSLTGDGWFAVTNRATIAGIGDDPNVLLGFEEFTGSGRDSITIRNISVSYKTLATPTKAGFATADGVITNAVFFGAETNYLGAEISATADANITNVVLTHTRTGRSQPKAVALFESSTVPGLWLSDRTVGELWGDVLEAGEVNTFTVQVEYGSLANLQTDSPESRTDEIEIQGKGVVWLNEVSLSGGWAELAAPMNRSVVGWSLRARQGDGAPVVLKTGISTAFDNENNRFGVGFAVVDNLDLSRLDPDVSTVFELVNASGVVESSRTVESLDLGATYAATGELSPRDSGDWAVWTDAGQAFGWCATTNATRGRVNEGVQGVLREVALPLLFRSKNQNNVTIFVAAKFSEDPDNPVTAQFVLSDDNPTEEVVGDITNKWYASEALTLSGFDSRDALPSSAVEITASAFGYEGGGEPLPAYAIGDAAHPEAEVNELIITMQASVGEEHFDEGFEGTWTRGGDTAYILWKDEVPYYTYGNTRFRQSNWRGATLTSVASLDATRGNTVAKLAVTVQNTAKRTVVDTMMPSLVDSNPDPESRKPSQEFMTLTDRYEAAALSDWVRTTQWLPLPLDGTLADAYQLMFSIKAGGNSGADLNFDDIYLSFQDYVAVTGLALEPLTPVAGVPLKATVSVDPGAAGATDVDVTIWTSLNGDEPIPAKVWHFDTLSAATNLVEADLLPLAGSGGDFVGVLNCWAEARYATRNGSRNPAYTHDVTYYPDNASESGGIRYVEGEYVHGRIAWGVQRVWVNEINPNGTPFVELCGRAGEDIDGWTLSASKPDGTESATYAVPAGTVLASTTNNCGFYVFSAASHTGFTLPTPGILRLLDAEGNVLYAYNYSASGPAPNDVDGCVNLGSAGGASLLATGRGNPANRGFAWTTGTASPGEYNEGEINAGQDLANQGPVAAKIEAVPAAGGVVALSAGAVDLDNPVEYRFSLDGAPLGDWATAAAATATGLAQNTSHAFSVATRDALGAEGSTASTNLYTLLDSWSASAAGSATDAITLTTSIPGLGNGGTAWWVAETDGVPEDSVSLCNVPSMTRSSPSIWGPNTAHAFELRARNGDGVLSVFATNVTAHTLAAVPGAMLSAEVDGEARSIALSLDNAADAAACRNGNAEDTEYAVRVTLFFKSADPVSYVLDLTNGTSRAETWFVWDDFAALFDDGADPVAWVADATQGELAAQDIAFEVVARNGEHVETAPQADTATAGVAHAHFEIAASLSAVPAQRRDGSGVVDLQARLTNPAAAPCDARLEFATGANPSESDWRVATIATASVGYGAGFAYGADPSGYTLRGIATSDNSENTLSIAWNAAADLSRLDYDGIHFRWVVYDAANRDEAVVLPDSRTASVRLSPPAVDSVTPPSVLKQASSLAFSVVFNEPVSNLVATATVAGAPRSGVIASPDAAAPSAAWTVSVPMTASDNARDSAAVVLTGLSGALDDFGNAMLSTNPAVSVAYDGKAPTPTLSSDADGGKQNTDTFTVSVSFSETVTGLAKEDFTIANGSATALSGSGTSYTLTVKCAANSAQTGAATTVTLAAGKCQDAAGNLNTAATQTISVTYDKTAPVPTLSCAADNTKQNTDVFTVTVTFDEAVDGLAKEDFTVANGSATALSGSGTSYTLTVKCADNSAQEGAATTVTLAADKCEDAAGNGNAAAAQTISVTYDKTAPTPTLSSAADGAKQNTDTFTVTVTFNEPVDGLAKEDFTVANGTATALSGSGTSYTLTVTCAANSVQAGKATTVTLAAGKCQDAAGNGNAAAGQTISVTYDKTSPKPTLSSAANGTKQKTDTFTVSVSFNETVTGLAASDFTVANGTATALSGSGTSYTLTVKCNANSAQEGAATTVTLAADKCEDAAGNGNTAAAQTISVTYDKTAPVPTLSSAADGKKQKTDTFTVTVTFNEPVSGLNKSEFTVANGSATALSGSGTNYTLTVTCAANSVQAGKATTVTLAAGKCQDAAGNGNAAAAQTISVTYDKTAPVPTLSSTADGGKQNTDTFTVTATFNEAVDGLAKEDFTVANGTATALSGSGTSYTLTVKCADNSAQEGAATTVTLAADKCEDAAGNGNAAAAQTISVVYDGSAPTVTSFTVSPSGYFNTGVGSSSESSVMLQATPFGGDTPTMCVEVEFSEPMSVSSLKGALDLVNAQYATFAGKPRDEPDHNDDTFFRWIVNPVDEGRVSIAVSTKATDVAGNHLAAAVPYPSNLVYDATAPVLSLANTPPATTSAGDFAIEASATEVNTAAGLALEWVLRDGGNAVVRSGSAAAPTNQWVVAGSGLGEGAYTFSATATDAAGNVSQAATCQWSVTRAKPTVTITAPEQQPVQGDTATFTVTFGEAVSGFEPNDLTVLGGTVVSGSFKSVAATAPSVAYEVQVQATRPGATVGLAVAEHVCTNALGIGNAAAGPVTCEVDYTAPVIGPLSVSPLRAKTGAPVTYSFDVTDVNLDTVTVVNQSVEAAAPSAAGVAHCTFATTATSAATFTIVATDTAGNSTTNNSVTSTLVVDTTPPTVTWSGLPDDNSTNDATVVIATLDSVSDGEDDPDPNIRVAWSVLRLAGNGEETVTSGEDWATTASPVCAQATLGAGDWAFDWCAWDTAGNTSAVERVSWTVAGVPEPVVGEIVAGVMDGTNAVFEVPGDASGEDVAKWLRLNNVDVEDVDVSYDPNFATTTVTVATAPFSDAGTTVELVVPAGAMGNTNEWSSAPVHVASAPPAPRLTYVGRRLDDPNILEWKLWNVDSMPDAGAFAVTDAKTGAPHTYQGRDPVAQPWTTNGYVCATVTDIFPTSGENSYTIKVFEMGAAARKAMEAYVFDKTRTASDTAWMSDAFVDHRLVYTDPASGTAVTNVGPAEVNLAMKAYGGIFKATTKQQNKVVVTGSRLNVRWGPDEADPTTIYTELFNAADGVLQTTTRGVADRKDQGATGIIPSVERIYGDQNMAAVALHGFGKDKQGNAKFNDKPIWDSHKAMAIRRIEWVCVPSNVVTSVGIAAITEAKITIRQHDGTLEPQWDTNVTFNVTQQTAKGYKYSVEIPDVVGGRVLLSNIRTTKPVTVASGEAYEIMLSEFAMFGAPVNTNDWSAPQVVSIKRSDTLASLPTNAVFTVAFDRTVRYCGNEKGQTPNANEVDFDTSTLDFVVPRGSDLDATGASFSATRLSDTEVEIVVTGLSGEGEGALVVGSGFAKTPGGVANAAATGPFEWFDAVVPTVAAEEITKADRAAAAETGLLRFGLDLSEPASGIDFSKVRTTGSASAELLSIASSTKGDAYHYDIMARVTGGGAGDTVSLALRPTVLTDLAGNTNTVSATWAAYTLTNATTAAMPTVTLAAGNGGTVSPLGDVAAVGGAVSATATPNEGYEFASWSFAPTAPSVVPTSATASFTGLADGTTITANFSPIGSVSVTATVSGSGAASWIGTASVPKGGSTNVLFTADAGCRIASVTTNNISIAEAASNTTYLVSLANLQADTGVTATFEKIPDVAITVTDGSAQPWTTNVVNNADWSHAFTAAEGKRIASLTVNGAALPAAVGATNYTAQLFGVIADTAVVVAYEDIPVPPTLWTVTFSTERGTAPATQTVEEGALARNPGAPAYASTDYTFVEWRLNGATYNFSTPVVGDITLVAAWEEAEEDEFTLSNLSWTGFDAKTGVLSFTATVSGSNPPETVTLVYRETLGGSDQTAAGCEWSLDAEKGEGTVTVPANLRSLPAAFFIGLEVGAEE